MSLEFLHDRPRLLYLFKLCCLCLKTSSPTLPAVVIGDINTSEFKGRFTDVALPSQSYMIGVPDSVAHCSSDDSMAKFSLLSVDFGRAAFANDYDPWAFVDSFGRSRIYESLLSSYKAASVAPSASVRTVEETASSSALSKQPALEFPSSTKRTRSGSAGTRPTTSSVKGVSKQGPSKKLSEQMFLCTFWTIDYCDFFCCFIHFYFVSSISWSRIYSLLQGIFWNASLFIQNIQKRPKKIKIKEKTSHFWEELKP